MSLYQLAARLPELRKCPDGLIRFNLNAPLSAIRESSSQLIREQQQRYEVEEARRRNEMLPCFLEAWDMREGWSNGRYDGGAAKTLRQIGASLGIPFQTAADHYRSAYRLIFAENYDPLRWSYFLRRQHAGNINPWASWRRPKTERESVTEVTETTLGTSIQRLTDGIEGEERAGQSIACDESAFWEFMSDLKELFQKGKSNEQIILEMELSSVLEIEKLLDEYRQRNEDGLL